MKIRNLFILFTAGLLLITQHSCQSDNPIIEEGPVSSVTDGTDDPNEIKTFNEGEVIQMEDILKEQGLVVEESPEDMETRALGIIFTNPCVRALKVTCKTPHPSQAGVDVDMSGVLLVPNKKKAGHRLLVVAPGTRTSNDERPSKMFKNMTLYSWTSNGWVKNNLFPYVWLAQAKGYTILIPDYLGFGDSFGQCVNPYLETKPMVNSIIDLIKAAQVQLTEKGYKYKKDIALTGYSQGGFIAASVARELELNPSHGMGVNFLYIGGAFNNLKKFTDAIRSSGSLKASYLLPYALNGFKNNGYPQLNVSDILQEPYATQLPDVFNGTHNANYVNAKFPLKINQLYTEKFIKNLDTDPDMAYINQMLDENSLKPWKNKCRFVITHGVKDGLVYYDHAKSYASEHNKDGGKVTFRPTTGNHGDAFSPHLIHGFLLYFPYYN